MSHWKDYEIDGLSDFLEAVGIRRCFVVTIFVAPNNFDVVENTARVHGFHLVETEKPYHYRVVSKEGTQPLPDLEEINQVAFYD